MKRSDALAPLSRDHHVALTIALGLRRADEASVAAAASRFVAFIEGEGGRHFDEEETELLPHATGEHAERTRREHVELRARADALRADAQVAGAHTTGDLLRDHVKFEENELFPYLERTLSAETLRAIGERLS